MKSFLLLQRRSVLAAVVVIVATTVSAETPVAASSCSQVALTLTLDRRVDLGTVTGRWGAYSATLSTSNTAFPFIYTGTVVVPQASYAASWGYTISLGSATLFDSGAVEWTSLGHEGEPCATALIVVRSPGGLTVRVFDDVALVGHPTFDELFGTPLDQGIEGASVHLCALALSGNSCLPGTEPYFESPKWTSALTDFTVDFFGLEGRYRIWEEIPAGYAQTYPRAGAVALGCGSNLCTAYDGYWILETRYGSAWLDFGNFTPGSCAIAPGLWRRANGQAILSAGPTIAANCLQAAHR